MADHAMIVFVSAMAGMVCGAAVASIPLWRGLIRAKRQLKTVCRVHRHGENYD